MKEAMKNILLFVAAMCLCSCGLYTRYERDDVSFTDSLYRRVSASEDTSSLASLKWEELFTDPQLQRWIRIGVANNTDLNVARLKVQEAEAALLSSRWALLPGVSASVQGGTPGTLTAGFDVSWQADIFGRLRNARRGAAAALEQSDAYRQAVQTQLVV